MKYWDISWNPISGCSPCSPGCLNCWAKKMAYRLKGRYGYPKDDPFKVTFHPERLNDPLKWKKPKRIFVCDMGDLFHEDVAPQWPFKIMQIIADSYWHTFLILTKRPKKMKEELNCWQTENIKNLWLGVTICNQDELWKVKTLLQIPAAHRWISIEPILGPVNLSEWLGVRLYKTLDGLPEPPYWKRLIGTSVFGILDWVVLGTESGPKRRPAKLEWIRSVIEQCKASGVPVFVKQVEVNGKTSTRPEEWPKYLRVREIPKGD